MTESRDLTLAAVAGEWGKTLAATRGLLEG